MGRSAFDCIIRSVILLGFSYLLFRLISTGEVLNYVHPRFLNLLKLTSGVLLVMTVVQFWMIFSSGHLHYPGQGNRLLVYGIFILPLLVGLLLPPRALDSYMARQKGVNMTRQAVAVTEINSSKLYQDSIAKDIWDPVITGSNFLTTLNEVYTTPQDFIDREIELVGFIYKQDDFSDHQFVVARFAVTCCTADATVAGFLCEYDQTNNFTADCWVKVKGKIIMGQYQSEALPVIKVSDMEKVEAPENPYVY